MILFGTYFREHYHLNCGSWWRRYARATMAERFAFCEHGCITLQELPPDAVKQNHKWKHRVHSLHRTAAPTSSSKPSLKYIEEACKDLYSCLEFSEILNSGLTMTFIYWRRRSCWRSQSAVQIAYIHTQNDVIPYSTGHSDQINEFTFSVKFYHLESRSTIKISHCTER
jgi:hypothetical protein